MSIFSLLKYQISIPPSETELKNLPPDVLETWAKTIPEHGMKWNQRTPYAISFLFHHLLYHNGSSDAVNMANTLLKSLRETIYNIDE